MGDSLISSFVVRIFKVEDGDPAADQNLWRVTVRQVQTDDERHFRTLDEAHAFMKSFVNARQNS